MDIRHLRCFMAVAEHLNFTKAAHQLCLTPSAISYQIASLERELGLKLLERAPNAVHFTPVGQYFFEGLREVLTSYEGLVSKAQGMASGTAESLAVGFLGGVEKRILPPLVKRFRVLHPGVSLRINRFEMVPLTVALEKGEVDIAFTLAVGLSARAGFRTKLLFTERLVVAMQADHPLGRRESLKLEDLEGLDFLDLLRPMNAPAHDLLVAICEKRGFTPRVVERFPNLDSLFLGVEVGVGIAIFPKYRVEAQVNNRLVYVPLRGEDSTTDCVVAWKPESTNPVVHTFLRELGVLG